MGIGSIGILSTWRTVCGIANFTADYHAGLAELGHQADIVPIDRDSLRQLARRELGAAFDDLAEQLCAFDIVHIQHEFGFFLGSYGMNDSIANFHRVLQRVNTARRPVVITFHTLPPFHGPRNRLGGLAREATLRALWRTRVVRDLQGPRVRAVVHTRLLRRALVDAGIPAASIKLIPCGSPPPVEQMDADEAKAALGYGPTDRVLVIFGFVSGYKGHRVAVEALRSLPAEYHLAIVGGPNPQVNDLAFDEVLQKSRRPRLAERVRVTGYVPFSDMRLYSSAADIVLAPYVTADLASSAAITWAMASGHPVIASRIPAFQELNEGVPRMVLATPRAPSELAHRILQLDQDEALKAELVKNALAYVTEHSWRSVCQEYLDLYSSL